MLASILAALLVCFALQAFAHHSFSAEYDMKHTITVTGVVTRVDWTNPHTFFYIQGKDETGREATWGFEGAAPSVLVRRGVPKNLLKVGDKVTIEGFRAKDNSDVASSGYVILSDGTRHRMGVVGGPTDEQ